MKPDRLRRLAARRIVLAVSVLALAGCGGSGSPVPKSTAASVTTARTVALSTSSSTLPLTTLSPAPTSTVARVTTAPVTVTTIVRARIESTDAVLAVCANQRIQILASQVASSERTALVYDVDSAQAAKKIGITLPGFDCSTRDSFGPDYSKFAVGFFTGGGGQHVGYVDLATSTLVDLTALRESSGFSNGVLKETFPRFQSASDRFRIENKIQFSQEGTDGSKTLTVDLANPAIAVPSEYLKRTGTSGQEFTGEHGNTISSPDGRFVADAGGGSGAAVWRYDLSTRVSISSECNPRGGTFGAQLLGWFDSRHFVLAGDERVLLVEIDDGSNVVGCKDVLPTNSGRKILLPRLRFDGKVVYVSTNGTGGRETYSIDLANPQEPVRASPAAVPSGVRFFFGLEP